MLNIKRYGIFIFDEDINSLSWNGVPAELSKSELTYSYMPFCINRTKVREEDGGRCYDQLFVIAESEVEALEKALDEYKKYLEMLKKLEEETDETDA